MITGQTDAATDERIITVSARRAESKSRFGGETVKLNLNGTEGIGKSGEPRAIKTLSEKLRNDGRSVLEKPREDETHDGILTVDGRDYFVEVALIPKPPNLWAKASKGPVQEQVRTPDAAEWLRQQIEHKTSHSILGSRRPKFVLALDAIHAWPLASPEVIESYLGTHGSPVAEFGFASVWIVGPAPMFCSRLGDGVP